MEVWVLFSDVLLVWTLGFLFWVYVCFVISLLVGCGVCVYVMVCWLDWICLDWFGFGWVFGCLVKIVFVCVVKCYLMCFCYLICWFGVGVDGFILRFVGWGCDVLIGLFGWLLFIIL